MASERKRQIYEKFSDVNPDIDVSKFMQAGKTIAHITDGDSEYKYCSTCEKWIDIDNFYKQAKGRWDGLDIACISCKTEKTKEPKQNYRNAHKEDTKEYNAAYNKSGKKDKHNRLAEEVKQDNTNNRHQKEFDKFVERAAEKDYQVISKVTDYKTAHDALWVKCKEDHYFEIIPDNLRKGANCPICSKKKQCKKCSKCKWTMLTKYFTVDNHSPDKLKYRCIKCSNKASREYREENSEKVAENGKKWREENADKVKENNRLPVEVKKANKKKRQEEYFAIFKETVEEWGGECISECKDYETAFSKLQVKCKYGHEFETTKNQVRAKKWCPQCSKVLYGESLTKYIIEHLFDCKFKKIRPKWLKNEDGNKLELDGYNKEMKIAFEYNGKQHYEFIPFFHRTKSNFEKRLKDDAFKVEKCADKGICLVIVPYTADAKDIPSIIINACEDNDIEVDYDRLDTLDFDDYQEHRTKFDELLDIIADKEGELISGTYVNPKSIMTVKCNNDHEFTTCGSYIQRGTWCPDCSRVVTEETKSKISKSMKEHCASDEGKEKKKKSHAKRSKTMANQKEEFREKLTHITCTRCKLRKSVDNFSEKNDSKSGYQSWCIQCTNENKRNIRAKAKEAMKKEATDKDNEKPKKPKKKEVTDTDNKKPKKKPKKKEANI